MAPLLSVHLKNEGEEEKKLPKAVMILTMCLNSNDKKYKYILKI